MRTTISIDDGLLKTAKVRADERGITLGALVEDGLRHILMNSEETLTVGPPLPVHHGGGFAPGVDPTSNASLFDAIGDREEEFERRIREQAADAGH